MEPGQLIYFLLSQTAPVTALAGTRIFPLRAEQGVPRPFITYQLISDPTDSLPTCPDNEAPRVQVSLFADSYAVLSQLARAVKNALHGYRSGQVTVDYENGTDLYDERAICFHRTQDYTMDYPADLTALASSLGLPASVATAVAVTGAVLYPFTNQSQFTIAHNLGRYVVVEIYAASGELIGGDVNYLTPNTLSIQFSQPLTGTVVLL